jgi:hypothetical protein
MIPGLVFLISGTFLTWAGWRSWRLRHEEAISLAEAAILKAADAEPLPRTKYDRVATRVHAIFGLTFGPIFALLGLALIANAAGLI